MSHKSQMSHTWHHLTFLTGMTSIKTNIYYRLKIFIHLKLTAMKWKDLKKPMLLSAAPISILALMLTTNEGSVTKNAVPCNNPAASHVCVMKIAFGLDDDPPTLADLHVPLSAVDAAVKKGLEWMGKAQGNDGGWGAGSHYSQGVSDPHAVPSDPATTSLICMALLRSDNSLEKGEYSSNLKKATEFLLKAVENCPDNQPYLTTLENTQPQVKLGRNIDVILTTQYLTNLLRNEQNNVDLKKRIEKALDKCIGRMQKGQDVDGGWKDGGWAPVLQSALANNALESAEDLGRKVDTAVLNKSRQYQNGNFDLKTNSTLTGKSAGVMLYSLSSTTRASAKDAKKAKDLIEKARKEGKIKDDKVTEENLRSAGASSTEAKTLVTGYSINEASRKVALRDDVMNGFGSNGGEEFLSYLMTGESMVMQGGEDWKKWYDMITGKLVNVQGQDGSWNGHHCITSPVFCTGTCLMILSIQKDMQFSMQLHPK